MTNEIIHNYNTISNQELISFLNNLHLKPNTIQKYLEFHYPKILEELYNRTSFLNLSERKYPITARIYCIQHNIKEHPKCKCFDCTNLVDWCGKRNEFRKYCSNSCSLKSDETKSKRKITMIERHGVEYYTQSKEFQLKSEETSIKHFGVKNPMQSMEVQRRFQESMLKNHNVRFSAQSKEIRDKMKSTCRKRYNVDNPMQNPDIHHKALQNQLINNNGIGFQSEKICEKFSETMMKRYGVDKPINSPEIRDKIKSTNKERLGVENPFQSNDVQEKIKQTNITKFGVEFPAQSDAIKQKMYNTSISNWGSWFSQTHMFHKLKKHKFHSEKYPGLTFDSTWEVKVYEFCRDNNIPVEYSPEISYPYEYDERTWTYHPDFLINGKVYEVKGDHFFRINESTGKEEMFNPYRSPKWSDEQYAWVCGKFEAKHQCMLENSIKIIRDSDISNLDMRMFS